MASKPTRPGAAKGKKGPSVGTGGHGRKRLEGKGPTPKAEDRKGHKAFRAKKSADKKKASGVKISRKGEFVATGPRTAGVAGAAARKGKMITKASESFEVLSGRNSVLEALRSKVPATAMFLAQRIEMDDRVKEAISLANKRGIPVSEVTRPEIDRMTGFDSVHQGIALQVPHTATPTPWNYSIRFWRAERPLSSSHSMESPTLEIWERSFAQSLLSARTE